MIVDPRAAVRYRPLTSSTRFRTLLVPELNITSAASILNVRDKEPIRPLCVSVRDGMNATNVLGAMHAQTERIASASPDGVPTTPELRGIYEWTMRLRTKRRQVHSKCGSVARLILYALFRLLVVQPVFISAVPSKHPLFMHHLCYQPRHRAFSPRKPVVLVIAIVHSGSFGCPPILINIPRTSSSP